MSGPPPGGVRNDAPVRTALPIKKAARIPVPAAVMAAAMSNASPALSEKGEASMITVTFPSGLIPVGNYLNLNQNILRKRGYSDA